MYTIIWYVSSVGSEPARSVTDDRGDAVPPPYCHVAALSIVRRNRSDQKRTTNGEEEDLTWQA